MIPIWIGQEIEWMCPQCTLSNFTKDTGDHWFKCGRCGYEIYRTEMNEDCVVSYQDLLEADNDRQDAADLTRIKDI